MYVASGPNLPRAAEQSNAPQVLMLVQTSPLEKKQVDEHAKKAFDKKFCVLLDNVYYQKHKQEEQASVLLRDFDFKTASVEKILNKLLAVVAAIETRVAFVVVMSLDTWKLNKEILIHMEYGDGLLICKTVFV